MPNHSPQAGRMVALTPKATPTSKTPLHMPPDVAKELRPRSSKSSSPSSQPPLAKAQPPAAMMWATPKLMGPPRRNQQEQEDPWQVQAQQQRMWNAYGQARGEDFEVDNVFRWKREAFTAGWTTGWRDEF